MATRRYLNFDLLLEHDGDGQYEARVTAAPVAGLPHVSFRLPFDDKSLQILLMELDPGRTDVRGVDGAVQQRAAKEFGGPLFDAIFTGKLASAWNSSLDKVAAQSGGGLRLRIRVAEEAADLAGLPWELLYDAKGRAFPAQSEITPLVRFLDVENDVEPIQVTGPLRVLAIISSPAGLRKLEVEREWAHLETALAAKVREGLVVLDRLPEPTVEALNDWLLEHTTHVIHFVGHGDFNPADDGEGFIFFEDELGGADPVPAAALGPLIRDHNALRMVVVNACRTARVGRGDPYGGMAQGLVLQGATAVVAMQFPITDPAAVMFTGKFYGALAAGLPVDQAVSYARKALNAKFRSEWATPVLFMRSPDGDIFHDVHAPPGWVVPQPPDDELVTEEPTPALPALSELSRTDLDVTDIADADDERPLDQTDPYGFLYADKPHDQEQLEQERLEQERLEQERLEQERLEQERLEQERLKRLKQTLAALAAAAVVIAVAVTAWLLRDEQVEPLPESQMLVAGGSSSSDLDIYRIDTRDAEVKERLTTDGNSWLPVLSPDRRTMIYLREGVRTRELHMASAVDGSGDQRLELPPPCSENASRPAWIPDTEDIVLRCEDDGVTLVRVGLDDKEVDVLLEVTSEPADGIADVGDPTVSGDGRTVVFFGTAVLGGKDGQLYQLDLDAGASTPELLLAKTDDWIAYSDPVFARPDEGQERLAWRAAEAREATEGPIYEVYTARFVDGRLGEPEQISDPATDGREQDPMFSPDGESIVYGAQPIDRATGKLVPTQALWVASVNNPNDRQKISPDDDPDYPDDPDFWAVPAWSGR